MPGFRISHLAPSFLAHGLALVLLTGYAWEASAQAAVQASAQASASIPTCDVLVSHPTAPDSPSRLISEMKLPAPVTHPLTAPRLVCTPSAKFPENLPAVSPGDWTKVAMVVDARGVPQQVHLVCSPGPGFDAPALQAAKQYRFRPGRRDGKPVPVNVIVAIPYQHIDSAGPRKACGC